MIINSFGQEDIYWITYNDANLTQASIKAAVDSGKTVACTYGGYTYYLAQHNYYNNMIDQYRFSTGVVDSITKAIRYFGLAYNYSSNAWSTGTWDTPSLALAGLSDTLSITYADGTTGTLNFLKPY